MSKKILSAFATVALSASVCSSAFADATLKMGDPAPALAVAKFVKGEPVKSFEKGKIYVVEFWATWCPPCRESIPHLSAMQKANPDVIFIGSDVGEDEAKVKPFVEKMGEKMEYRVAIDDLSKEHGANDAAFMEAADQHGIPTAFVIDKDSKVAWIGHPAELEPVLKQVVAGTYDIKKATAAAAARDKVMGFLQQNDLDGAIKATQEIVAGDPAQAATVGALEFALFLQGKKDPIAAAKVADEIAPKIEDERQLNAMAWALATADKTSPESLATAQKLSEASLKKAPDSSANLDTLARVYAVKKDFPKAIEIETKAMSKAASDDEKAASEKTLAAYKAGNIPEAEKE